MVPAKINLSGWLTLLVMAFILSDCTSQSQRTMSVSEIRIDGSSTVFPLSEAAAEDYHILNQRSRILIGISGTLSGFTKFSQGLTDVNNASRAILPAEDAICRRNGVNYITLPLCYDEIMVLVSKSNTWADSLSLTELRLIWSPASQGKIIYWSQIRNGWPHQLIHLYSPGPASGTFEYFTEAINGKARLSREDVNPSFDPERLVQNLSSDPLGLSYFGYNYYRKNMNSLRKVPLKKLAVYPAQLNQATSTNGNSRNPLSRILFLYINKKALEKKEFRSFILFYLAMLPRLIAETGYIPLTKATDSSKQRVDLLMPKPNCSAVELEIYLRSYQLNPAPQ